MENKTLTQQMVEEWITNQATGTFHYTKVMDGRINPELYPAIRTIMHRCKEKGIAMPVNGKDGWWRPADPFAEEVYWWDIEQSQEEHLLLPLELHKYCHIPRPAVVLVAGLYNAGKTAFAINTVNLNLEKWADNINFYVSEGAEMMNYKFKALNAYIPKPPPFKMFRRTENFADVINPDALSIIDYLRVDMTQTYAVSTPLFHIFNKLKTGIAVVCMQKPPGRKLAFGGAATAFEPALYISMDKGYLEFEKIKIPKLQDYDPYLLKIRYKISKGVNFIDVVEEVG